MALSYLTGSRFHIVHLGCKVNRVEADSLTARLLSCGYEVSPLEVADIVFVNTCTVTAEADKKARKAVRHALSLNADAPVIVMGCAAALNPDDFCSISPRVSLIGTIELDELFDQGIYEDSLRFGKEFRTRVGIKIQDGCDHACTYCIVATARGKARSVSAKDVLAEAEQYLAAGVKEIVLVGIDIGAYHDSGTTLPQLIEQLVEVADKHTQAGDVPARIRISSIEPLNVDRHLIDLLAQSEGRVCRHLHLPLQSGSEKVLKEMNRPYDMRYFKDLVASLYEAIPQISLSTDIICGFPGETEQDFLDTCNIVREARFSRLHVFPYSERKGTPAALRADQISPEIRKERAAYLRKLGADLQLADKMRRRGTYELALVEGQLALTESYHEVQAPPDAPVGKLVSMCL